MAVRVEPVNEGNKLRAGMFAKLNIVTAVRQGALLVPREAIVAGPSADQGTVVSIGDDNRAHRLQVRLGLTDERFTEVVGGGLQEGQLVATSGVADLSEGDLVTPRVQEPAARLP